MKKLLVLLLCLLPSFVIGYSIIESPKGVWTIKGCRTMYVENKEYFCCPHSYGEECKSFNEWIEEAKNIEDIDFMSDLREVDLSSRYSMSDEKVDFDKLEKEQKEKANKDKAEEQEEKKSLGSKVLEIITYPFKACWNFIKNEFK